MYLFPTEKELNALWRQINPGRFTTRKIKGDIK